jgi:anti-anti-sigma factor
MQTLEEYEGDLLIVSLRGHLDTVAAPLFEYRLTVKIDAGARSVIIDCSGLDYVNSAGLKSFLLLAKRLETLGGKFIICALLPHVTAVFATIGFDQIMIIVPTRQDAVRWMEGAVRPA